MFSRIRPSLRFIFSFVALAVPVTGPAAGAVFSPETFTLSNGLQVVVVENHRVPAITQMLWYKVGAADEPTGLSGVAHYLEHLMFKGTETLAPGEFSELVAANGGRENAFTGQDYTAYHQTVARDRLELVMRLEADRMANLMLTDEVARPEVLVVLEERRSRIDNNPHAKLGVQMRAALYLNHPYGQPIIGWEHEIQRLSTDNVTAFYRRYYAPNNAILVVAGDITAEELRPLAEKYYGAIPARPVPPRIRPMEPPPTAARRVIFETPDVRQPALIRNYLAPSYTAGETDHAYPLQILSEILGQGATSRFYRRLVIERELAVSANAYYDADSLDLSRFTVSATPRLGVELSELEAAVDSEIERLLEDGVENGELERTKRRMRAAAIYARDSLHTGARVLGAALAVGRMIEDVESWPDRIAAVTVDEVNGAARSVLRLPRSVTGLLLPASSD